MLVLTRVEGESLSVDLDGTTVTVTIVRVKGSRVRLAVAAPPEVAVRRREGPSHAAGLSRAH